MALNVGRRLGPYEIAEKLGAGGMGEVYRARDTRLNRTVAIKILSAEIAADRDRRQRFRREAEAVAALSHPHICVLHDIGEDDGIDYLVMEYLAGETLATRRERGPLPIASVLDYAIDIADALDQAHRAGVIHRDLKPSNIMLTQSGTKLLDFGLAKLRPAAGVMGREQSSPTVTAPLTGEGTLLGTLPYMAPEQLEGKEADARTDVFALGAIIYEMTAGRRAFEGHSDATLIGAILRDEPPPMSALQPLTPRALERLVRTCLEKNPDDRWQSTGDLKRELRWIREEQRASTSDAAVPAVRRLGRVRGALIAAAGAVIGIVAVLVVNSLRDPTDAGGLTRFTIDLEDSPVAAASAPLAQISPDGRRVAFIVRSRDADTRICLRSLGALEAQPVSGTEGALSLFWSPDGRHIAFATASALKKLPIGRTVETLCNACRPARGGTWSRSGSILFPSQDGGLLSIPEGGGEPQPVTSLDKAQDEIAHIAPQFLPDGRRFLYVIRSTQANRTGLYVGQVGLNEPRLLLRGEHPAVYAAPGYLLFIRAGNIVAQPFDLRRLELSGATTSLIGPSEYSPTPLQGGDITSLISSGVWPSFSVSQTGILTYAIAEHPDSQFQWRERAGEQPPQLLYQPGPYMTFDLSPDGTRLVFARRGEHSSLWVIDLANGLALPLTFGASSYSSPRWASDSPGGRGAQNHNPHHWPSSGFSRMGANRSFQGQRIAWWMTFRRMGSLFCAVRRSSESLRPFHFPTARNPFPSGRRPAPWIRHNSRPTVAGLRAQRGRFGSARGVH